MKHVGSTIQLLNAAQFSPPPGGTPRHTRQAAASCKGVRARVRDYYYLGTSFLRHTRTQHMMQHACKRENSASQHTTYIHVCKKSEKWRARIHTVRLCVHVNVHVHTCTRINVIPLAFETTIECNAHLSSCMTKIYWGTAPDTIPALKDDKCPPVKMHNTRTHTVCVALLGPPHVLRANFRRSQIR